MSRRPWRPSLSDLLLLVLFSLLLSFLFWKAIEVGADTAVRVKKSAELPLRFRYDGTFKILQVADMHFGNGAVTRCRDVFPFESARCSDLNTTQFLRRMIEAEKPDLIAFTGKIITRKEVRSGGGITRLLISNPSCIHRFSLGQGRLNLLEADLKMVLQKEKGHSNQGFSNSKGDNIFGTSATDAAESLFRVFRPAMESRIPWAAILGNHDQESTMTRGELMSFISLMDYSVSQLNPPGFKIDGFGNYDIRVHGAFSSGMANTSVLNLYFLDSGDRATVGGVRTYGWIRESQLAWLRTASQNLQGIFPAPVLTFFHIPIPEVRDLWYTGFVGKYQEAVACSIFNSGVLKSLVSMGDVKAVFLGHDHLNDFCGSIDGIWFCYGGGFGYHGYGRAGWPRRGRVISAQLRKGKEAWMGVESIRTWKRLDDENLTKIDEQVLWSDGDGGEDLVR